MKQKGFSLTEVTVALILLAIISLFSAPQIMQKQRQDRLNSLESFIDKFHDINQEMMTHAKSQGAAEMPLAKLSELNIYVRLGTLALDDFNVEKAMGVQGLNLANIGPTEKPSLLIYLGKEKSPEQIKESGCFLSISRPSHGATSLTATTNKLTITKFYDYC
ncbi:type II secretion system protein [Vibrio harveyi]|uniref:type II secretion system protein n=1 Tax=Vibrio harveyi TaxID=669 RepID=UPI000A16EB45|nr:prepilin-type N-terminal cleavage/methylation domain-containing protein [Vibrio harveyi]HDM8125742.1 prepilin-type N-terminal cleavage/methylation domain-containing protein [Vibrio harveyi]